MRKTSTFAPIVAVLVAAGVLFEAATSSLVGADAPVPAVAVAQSTVAESVATENWVETGGKPDQGDGTPPKKSKDKPSKPKGH